MGKLGDDEELLSTLELGEEGKLNPEGKETRKPISVLLILDVAGHGNHRLIEGKRRPSRTPGMQGSRSGSLFKWKMSAHVG